MLGKLYIVGTPIGNLDDISCRAIKTLSEVNIILAEDTRVTKKLTARYQISTKIISYHQHSKENNKLRILKDLVEGKNIALVTDAGTPGISDPGNELIDYLLDKDPSLEIIPIPGPSALSAALSICGFRVDRFTFVGFLPKRKLSKIIAQIKSSGLPLVFFDSPKRIMKTIDRLIEEFGEDRRVFVGRELTKMYEEKFRGSLVEVKVRMQDSDMRGEVVVVVEGR